MDTDKNGSSFEPAYLAFTATAFVNLAINKWRPDSITSQVSNFAMIATLIIWLGLSFRAGYLRRRPYWTRDSWLRYARLASLPMVAILFVLTMSTESGMRLMGEARSSTRALWVIALLVLLVLGAIGIVLALQWLRKGDPSVQFTRSSWLPRR